jgi:nitroreductase
MSARIDLTQRAPQPTPQQRLRERYGDPSIEPPEVWSAVVDHLLDHRSVRRFLPDPVTEAQLRTIIAAAQSAPSSSNLHAWSVVAVTDTALRERLAELVGDQPAVRAAPLQLVWLADLSMLEGLSKAKNFPAQGLDFLEMFVIGAIDASLASQNAAIAAESVGLATVYIGGIRNRIDEVAQLLGLPPRVAPVFGLCVGTPDPKQPTAVKPRPPQSVVLHRERYDPAAALPGLEAYEKALARFYEGQSVKVENWIMRSLRRVASPQALTGRDRLRDALQRMGFPLK